MLRRYLIIWLVLSSLAAFYWPHWFPDAPDVFAKSASLLSALITVTMFAIGWMLPRDEVRQLGRRWPTVLGGTAIQYVTMPTLAYLVGRLWGLSGDHLIGIVMVGCVPGAMASNVLTFNAGGNTSYSVSLTTSATLLSPLAVPIVLGLALHGEKSVNVWLLADDASRKLLLTVVIPVVLGHLLSRRFPRWESTGRRLGSIVANLAILWIIAVVVALNRDRLSPADSDVPLASLLLGLLMVNVGGYFAGYLGSVAMRLPVPMRRALTLEVGMQNAGLGAFLAKELFEQRDSIAIAPAMYTFGCMLTGTLLATVWARLGGRASSATDQPE